MLRVDRQSDTRALALAIEQFMEDRLTVTDAHHPRLAADLLYRGGSVGKCVKPSDACETLAGQIFLEECSVGTKDVDAHSVQSETLSCPSRRRHACIEVRDG